MNPTYVIAVGSLGAAVAARLQADEAAAPVVLKYFPLPADSEQSTQLLADFAERAAADLYALLRGSATQNDSSGGSSLDLVVIADLAEAGGGLLGAIVQQLSALLRRDFAVMFPPGASPEQRSVWLVMVLTTPSLDDTPSGQAARLALAALERWHHSGPPTPILSRIYLLPEQNEVMPLSRLDLERGVYLFIATAYLSGLRETEAMRSRLQPPRTATCLLATFAVAAIDVEVDKVLAAFAWRAAIAALEGLAAQCETPAAPERVLAVADELSLNVWCRELMGIELGPRRPAISQGSRLAAADRAETEALQKGRRSVRELVDSHLVGENGLGGFQLVAHSLALAGKRIEDLQNELARGWLPAARLDSPVQQPAEQRTVAALTQAPPPPRLGRMLPLGVLLGTVVGIAVTGSAAVVAASRAASTSAGGPSIAGRAPLDPAAVLWGLLAAGIVVAGWLALHGWSWRRYAASQRIASSPLAVPRAGESSEIDLALAAALVLRKRRVARGVLGVIADEAQRLDALRAAVLDALSHARDRLRSLGVKQGERPAQDDYSMLLSSDSPLHRGLLPATALPQLWERNRAIRDEKLWAGELLQRAWPAGGIREDLPFGPGESWEAVLAQQHQSLRDKGVFAWPELGTVLTEHLGRFLRTVPRLLKFGVHSRRPDGSPSLISHAQELLVVVPPDGRALIERLLREQALPEVSLLSSTPQLSRVLVLRTATEFDVASLEPMAR